MVNRTNWNRQGECRRCGECCEYPSRERINAYGRAGFEYRTHRMRGCSSAGRTEDGRIFCKDYGKRPEMCRRFPEHPVDIVTIPGCGYSFREAKGVEKTSVFSRISRLVTKLYICIRS